MKGGYWFWEHIHPLFLDRDLTRHDLRTLVSSGLNVNQGNYRTLVGSLGMPATDYKRFMNFLATHECRVDYQAFRHANGAGPRPIRKKRRIRAVHAADARLEKSRVTEETRSVAI